jgi:choline dehydrogenase-like flavoprotein
MLTAPRTACRAAQPPGASVRRSSTSNTVVHPPISDSQTAAMHLPAHVRSTSTAIAEVALPAGSRLPAGGAETVSRLERAFVTLPEPLAAAFVALSSSANLLALRCGRRRLELVHAARRLALLESWRTHGPAASRLACRALMAVLKGAHHADRDVIARSGCRLQPDAIQEPTPRWLRQVHDLSQPGPDDTVEADVVVIGSGAGGAAAARELATRGLATVVLESGALHRRADFVGSIIVRSACLYASYGLQYTIGNASIFLPTGEGVGGTTLINAGTCLRTPPWVLRRWREREAVPLGERELDPYFERVERWLEVGLPDERTLGTPAKLVAKGAEALGLAHGPLLRAAPGCDAMASCCFGCPSGAKRSADIALLPAALEAGAVLFTHAHVHGVGRSRDGSVVHAGARTGRRLSVRARSVVFAAGALRTPVLLRGAGVRHPWLGRNLSIHPAAGALGIFPFEAGMDESIPQGYGLEALREEGLLFETAGLPFEIIAISLHQIGPRYVELLEQYRRMIALGFNVRDSSRGRVVAGPRGVPLPLYSVGAVDLAQFERGLRVLHELLFRAGATLVVPGLSFADEIHASCGAHPLDGRRLRASDMDLSAYHPLGTARMGADPLASVIDMSGRVRGAREWLVCDGSAVPTSIGANPQVTIMALALRAAGRLAERLGS